MSGGKERLVGCGLLWLRVLMGTGSAHHGFTKLFGGRMDQFAAGVARLGFPQPHLFAWAAALSEFLGGILIVLGFHTRVAAYFVFTTMSVAVFLQHTHDPLSVKELALAYWTMAGTLILAGAGPYSLDGRPRRTRSLLL